MKQNLSLFLAISSVYLATACSSNVATVNNTKKLSADQQQQVLTERAAQLRQTHVRFNALDINEDGYVSLDEFNRSGDRSFKRRDTNNDGVLSEADPKAPPRGEDTRTAATKAADLIEQSKQPATLRRQKRLINMPTTHSLAGLLGLYDSNNDQKVSKVEYNAARLHQFKTIDSNGDGHISYDEYIQEFAQRLDQQIGQIDPAAANAE